MARLATFHLNARAAGLWLGCVLLALPALAQQTVTISGQVRSPAGRITNTSIQVILYTETGAIVRQDYANADGFFTFTHVATPANYRLVVKAEGFQPWEELLRLDMSTPRFDRVYVTLQPTEPPKQNTEATHGVSDYLIPKRARREFEKGRKAIAANEFEKAVAHLRKALEIHSSYLEALKWLGIVQSRQGQYEEAERSLRQAVALDEKYADAFAVLGAFYGARGRHEEAVPLLERAVQLEPAGWQAQYELSLSYFALGELDKSLAACKQAVLHHPGEFPEALVHRGNIFLRQERYREALAEFTAFLERYPENQYAAYARQAVEEIQRRTSRR